MYQVTHYINGQRVSDSAQLEDLYNPATGEMIGQVMLADKNIILQAITSAKNAFQKWSKIPPAKRAQILFTFKMLLEQSVDELAEMIVKEHGKTLNDARGSIKRGIEVVDFACGIPNHLKGSFVEEVSTNIDSYSFRQPLGICVGITPFNFPAMIPLWMFPLAVACGNTFILKPSEKDPSCAIRLAELAKEAGFLPGVLNVVQGDKETVDLLINHPEVKAISFVGSTKVAEHIYQTGIMHGKRVQAFGGAKNHCIVMPDADLTQTAAEIVGAAYGSAGERCMAISVVIAVGDTLAEKLIQILIPRIQQLKIGAGNVDNTEMGPVIRQAHLERIQSYLEIGIKEGADLVVDGRAFQPSEGYFIGGSLFDKVEPSMRIYKEEIFGPVLCIVRVPDFNNALKLINEHEYGNGTALFTQSAEVAKRFVAEVQVGMVGINVPIPVPAAYLSFGGWKRSMFGDINMHGLEGIQFYTKQKTVTQRWFKDSKDADFSMPTH